MQWPQLSLSGAWDACRCFHLHPATPSVSKKAGMTSADTDLRALNTLRLEQPCRKILLFCERVSRKSHGELGALPP